MDESATYERIAATLVELFELERARIKPTSTLRGALALDSADLIDLVMRLEADFGLSPELDGYRNVSTTRELAAFVAANATRTP
jgi:acyl carrier protein